MPRTEKKGKNRITYSLFLACRREGTYRRWEPNYQQLLGAKRPRSPVCQVLRRIY